MKVLFVYPFFLEDSVLEQQWQTPYFPLGILYMAAAARGAGHDVTVFDGTFTTPQAFYETFERLSPDALCIASVVSRMVACATSG